MFQIHPVLRGYDICNPLLGCGKTAYSNRAGAWLTNLRKMERLPSVFLSGEKQLLPVILFLTGLL